MPSKRKSLAEKDALEGSKRSRSQASDSEQNDVALDLDSVTESGGVIGGEKGAGEVLGNGNNENTSKLLDEDVKQKDRIEVQEDEEESVCRFIGEPVSDEEARQRWPHRYKASSEVIRARRHFTQAEVDGQLYSLEDEAYVKTANTTHAPIQRLTDIRDVVKPPFEMPGCLVFNSEVSEHNLYDHRPYLLNQDDFQRVCRIPKKKGANFRDLPGVRVRADNKVEFDPDVERVKLPSGKPLVPDYAMTCAWPFGRLWWDETVATVVTRAEPHNQTIVHPVQDRVLTIRENARLQGFPDYYKLLGPIKERYIQVGNAVAVPVARALGYSLALALALKGLSGDEPLFTLPEEFPKIADATSPEVYL